MRQAGRLAGRQAGRQGGQAGRQAGRQVGKQAGRQVGKQATKQQTTEASERGSQQQGGKQVCACSRALSRARAQNHPHPRQHTPVPPDFLNRSKDLPGFTPAADLMLSRTPPCREEHGGCWRGFHPLRGAWWVVSGEWDPRAHGLSLCFP